MIKIHEPSEEQLRFSSLIKEVVLASKSENRKALLEKDGTRVIQVITNADENKIGDSAEEKVLNIAKAKMDAYLNSPFFRPNMVAISADTMVLFSSSLIGKAKDREEAKRMLESFSSNEQKVISASCIYIPQKGLKYITDTSAVIFKSLSDSEIEEYLDTGDWIEAAGAYRLQRNGYKIVDRIEGDWHNIVGLPLKKINDYISSL